MDVLLYTGMQHEQIFQSLKTSAQGLSNKEAQTRLQQYGPNKVNAQNSFFINFFYKNLTSYYMYLLLGSALIAFFLGEYLEGIMIVIFILINVSFSFYVEYKAHKASELLQTFLKSYIKVMRDGKITVVETTQLVPGDLIFIEQGTILPADVRFIKQHTLMIDEATLTGESVPVAKHSSALPQAASTLFEAANLGFNGTTVVQGRGVAIVLATGPSTLSGSLAMKTSSITKESVFAREIDRFGIYLLILVLITLSLLFIINVIIKGSNVDFVQLFIFSLALAVGITPETLPIVRIFCLSLGALRLAKSEVIITRLAAIEDLGSIDILCTDKTGTLTENNLTLGPIYGQDHSKILLYANLAGASVDINQTRLINPIEMALWNGLSKEQQEDCLLYKRIFEIPFDFKRLRNDLVIQQNQELILIVRGIVETVLPACSVAQKEPLIAWAQEQEKLGNRVLVVAYKNLTSHDNYKKEAAHEQNLEFLGMISLFDPIREDAHQAVLTAQKLGITLKILTGDSPQVASAVGFAIGLINNPDNVITGSQLQALSLTEQHEAILNNSVFARIQPEQKLMIVKSLQENHLVGYLGDGINDLSALHEADVAIVVQGAADSARNIADIILLRNGLIYIIHGIAEGRIIYANTIKYIKTELATIFGNFYSIAVASLFINFLPLLPLQILLMNILSDVPMLSLATDTVDKQEMQHPKNYNFKDIIVLATILGMISSLFDFIVFAFFYKTTEKTLQTTLFIEGILTELILIYSTRTKNFLFKAHFPSWSLIILTIATALVCIGLPYTWLGQSIFSFTKPTLNQIIFLTALTFIYLAISEAAKLGYYYFLNNKKAGTR